MKTGTILFMMASGYGHLNPTFELATRLKEQGFRIVYAVPAKFQELVEENGFSVIDCNPHLFKFGSDDRSVERKYEIKNIFHRIVDRITNLHVNNVREAAKRMNTAIAKVQPDMLLLDSLIAYNYFLLTEKDLPIVLIQTMLGTRRRVGVPPLNSSLLPLAHGEFNSILEQLSWMKYRLTRSIKLWMSMGDNRLGVIGRTLERTLAPELESRNAFRPGIKGLEEIVIAPKVLDYEEITPTSQLYLASTVYQNRKEEIVDDRLRRVIYDLVHGNKEKTWVYCSLGTLNQSHNQYCQMFFAKMIELFAQKPSWELIMSTGEVPVNKFKVPTNNIHLFQRVPQLKIVEHCSVAIIHGGLNSVMECIHFAKPMLVYPLTNIWDQAGNAARVVHYGLGLRGNLERATTTTIETKIQSLISDDHYRKTVKDMQGAIRTENTNFWQSGQLEELIGDLWVSNKRELKATQYL